MNNLKFKNMDSKRCTKCGDDKPVDEFRVRKDRKVGIRSACILCDSEKNKEYYHTKEGLLTKIYGIQRTSSRKRNHILPTYTKIELGEWLFTQPNFNILFEKWIANNFNTLFTPSINRLNDYLPYTLDNIELLSWGEHKKKTGTDQKNGINNKKNKPVICINIDNGNEVKYISTRDAERKTNVSSGSISSCCKYPDKFKTAGGYKWIYA